ncbi:MAG TPA: hypothetical protein VF139_02400 [Candidatus Polarisedimenticolaceae bacterium]
MPTPKPPKPRLSVLFASKAPTALILRRGPTNVVELVSWNTETDTFDRGHWFRGRIYERRCDLSPDGSLFVYFASKFNRRTVADRTYTYAWTAVSKPPYLTALALWPKGDCWWGGGLFQDRRTLLLNHRPTEATPHPEHPPRTLRVVPNPDASGEDYPIFAQRLERDGWTEVQAWETTFDPKDYFATVQPGIRKRVHPRERWSISMICTLERLRYKERFEVEGPAGPIELPRKSVEWVDWDQRGRLVVLADGCVWAAEVTGKRAGRFARLVDLTDDRFETKEAPEWARRWKG